MSAFGGSSRRVRCPPHTDTEWRTVPQTGTEWRTVPRKELPSKERAKACYQCGGPHLARDCPTASEYSVECYRCGGSHLARNCSLPYKAEKFSNERPAWPAKERKEAKKDASHKPGDWWCSSCGDHQFARNEKCRMCGAAKPEDEGGKSMKDWSLCSIDEDDETVSKSKRPVASPKQPPASNVVKPDLAMKLDKGRTSTRPNSDVVTRQGGSKQSWADIVDDEDEEQEKANRQNTPSNSTSAGVSDASSQADDFTSEDCVLPGHQSDMVSFPAWQQFWEDPMACAAGDGFVNAPENFGGAVEFSQVDPMSQVVMCGSEWPGMWWPTYPQNSLQPMQQCPNGHQLVDGAINALDNFMCDGCGIKVPCDDHVMECKDCNWGLCKRFCCVEATLLNPGDRVKSLCAEPSWTPRPMEIGDEGIVVENLPDCRVAVEFNGVTGWLYTANLQKLETGDSSLWPAGGVETFMVETVQDTTIA